MIVDGPKKYLFDRCIGCKFASFEVAQGLHPDYGWWIQVCNLSKSDGCKPVYEFQQLSLF